VAALRLEGVVTARWVCGRAGGRITERMNKISYAGHRSRPRLFTRRSGSIYGRSPRCKGLFGNQHQSPDRRRRDPRALCRPWPHLANVVEEPGERGRSPCRPRANAQVEYSVARLGAVTPAWIGAARGLKGPRGLQAAVAARHVQNASSRRTRSVRREVR
jgi:hypothetical protein